MKSVLPKECEEIKALATGDVEAGIPRRTSYAIEQYKELHPQWKTNSSRAKIEVGTIYDNEFRTQEELNKKDPQKAFQNLFETGLVVPILLALAAIVGAILKDTLTQWVTKLWQAIADWTYARFAGTAL
ncbi:MAG: hypothetical protein LH679_11465, partial [Cyanobacteria bacterium CAN_BIN43]|nr:hypothetical protein [Cyanobacteria bacterium CAN_BIN43]